METAYYLAKFDFCNKYCLSNKHVTSLDQLRDLLLMHEYGDVFSDIVIDKENMRINYTRYDPILDKYYYNRGYNVITIEQVKVTDDMSLRDRYLALNNASLMYHFLYDEDEEHEKIDNEPYFFLKPEDCGFYYDQHDVGNDECVAFYITPLNYYKLDGIPDWFGAPKFLREMEGFFEDWDEPCESIISTGKLTLEEAVAKLKAIGMKDLKE